MPATKHILVLANSIKHWPGVCVAGREIQSGNTGRPWKSVNSQYAKPDLDLLVETPADLWLERNERKDRVSSSYIRRQPLRQSLYLVRVQTLRARFEWNAWDGRFKQRRRAVFVYNGVEYEFNITDPVFSERYRSQFPVKGQPPRTFAVNAGADCHLCVSLAPEFSGYHYKLVATVFE